MNWTVRNSATRFSLSLVNFWRTDNFIHAIQKFYHSDRCLYGSFFYFCFQFAYFPKKQKFYEARSIRIRLKILRLCRFRLHRCSSSTHKMIFHHFSQYLRGLESILCAGECSWVLIAELETLFSHWKWDEIVSLVWMKQNASFHHWNT